MNGAAAKPAGAGAEVVRGASAVWWRHDGTRGKLYVLDVYDSTGTFGTTDPHSMRAYFGAIPCGVGGRDRPRDCNWRLNNFRRIRVDSFEIDPLMESAHAVVHAGDRRGEITWTGRGDYGEPFVWESFGQHVLPPYFASAHASVIAFIGRNASARGDMFGLDLKRGEFQGAGMGDIVFAGASVCAGLPWCWRFGTL